MNPNGTKSVNLKQYIHNLYEAESKLYKIFAWWPKRINGELVWLKHYYVQYNQIRERGFYTPGRKPKKILATHTESDIVAETLKGNVVHGKLLTTRKRSIREWSDAT